MPPCQHRWKSISEPCKDLLRKLFKAEPSARLTAVQALNHPWIDDVAPESPIPVIEIVEKLRRHQTTNKAKRIIQRKLAQTCCIPAAAHLAEVFDSLDPNNSGAITVEGLKAVLRKGVMSDSELQGAAMCDYLIEIVDKFSTPICLAYPEPCQITFSDFVAVMYAPEFLRNIPALQFVFSLIDVTRSGFVTSHNLYFTSYLMGLSIKPNEVQASTNEYQDKLDFDAFVHLLSQSTRLRSNQRVDEGPDHEASTDSEGVAAVLHSHAEAQRNSQKAQAMLPPH